MQIVAVAIIAIWMLGGGAAHLLDPHSFFPLVPGWLPKLFVVYASGGVEILIGLMVVLPKTRALGGLAFAGLCLGLLPLHLWDFFRVDPVFSVPVAATIRVLVQFGLIALGLFLWRRRTG